MAAQIQIRRGLASAWTTANPVIAEGELCVELDTGRFKIGNGVTAWNGLAYSTGPQGATGFQGSTGASGVTGFTGATGASGFTGATGASGVTGYDGATGASGVTGYTGATGASGVTGFTGATGASGVTGYDGATGASGVTGYDGATGASGVTGFQGATGYIGSTGASGVTGYSGATGQTGETGLGFAIAKTYISVAALTADTTPTGIVPGQFALIDTGSVQDAETSRLYLWNNNTYTYITDLSGSQGIKGETGYQGATGVTGFIGATGASGVTGYTGATGASGVTGYTGASGATGITGYEGATGVTGFTGATGASGITGLTGATGSGSTGVTGYTGATGIQGPAGVGFPFIATTKTFTGDGSTTTFTIDSDYTADSVLVTVNGILLNPTVDYTVSGTTLTFIIAPILNDEIIVRQLKGDGTQGATGASGIQGLQGATGSGATGLGATGLTGATGVQGATGAGATGLTGATGPSGAYAGQGYQGATGLTFGYPFSIETLKFTASGSTSNFTINSGYDTNNILVVVNGAVLEPTTDYTVNGTTLTFTVVPAAGQEIVVRMMKGDGEQGLPGATGSQGVQGATGPVSTIDEFTAIQDQTVFTVSSGYTSGSVLVYKNGSQLNSSQYYAVNGSTVTLTQACTAGDIIRVLSSIGSLGLTSVRNFAVAMSVAMGV